jgi:hypothetical protein
MAVRSLLVGARRGFGTLGQLRIRLKRIRPATPGKGATSGCPTLRRDRSATMANAAPTGPIRCLRGVYNEERPHEASGKSLPRVAIKLQVGLPLKDPRAS